LLPLIGDAAVVVLCVASSSRALPQLLAATDTDTDTDVRQHGKINHTHTLARPAISVCIHTLLKRADGEASTKLKSEFGRNTAATTGG